MENLTMDNTSSVFLPHILQTLSQKPNLSDTYENLCAEIEDVFSAKNPSGCYGNIEKKIENALNVGKNLGILVVTDDLIRMPFKYNTSLSESNGLSNLRKNSSKGPTVSKKGAAALYPQKGSSLVQPRRTYTVQPTVIAHGRRRNSKRGRSRSRSRSRSATPRSRSRGRRRPSFFI